MACVRDVISSSFLIHAKTFSSHPLLMPLSGNVDEHDSLCTLKKFTIVSVIEYVLQVCKCASRKVA